MPTYQYACTQCGHEFEQVQSFSEDSLTTCPQCSGKLRKLFGAVGVVFKGSGFYRTDSRADSRGSSTIPAKDTSGGSAKDSGGSPEKSSSGSSDKGSSGSADKGSSGGSSAASSSPAPKPSTPATAS